MRVFTVFTLAFLALAAVSLYENKAILNTIRCAIGREQEIQQRQKSCLGHNRLHSRYNVTMRVFTVFTLAFLALAAAESKKFSNDRKVALVSGHLIPHKPSTRITNGNEAVPHSRPWQVELFTSGVAYCGGSLIDELNVLTAGNCLYDGYGEITVVLGAHNIDEYEDTQVEVKCRDYIRHEEHDNLLNDIGLIRLPSPVTFNENIQPISLDNSSCIDDYAGRDASVSGWGRIGSSSETSSVLLEVIVPVISNDECASYLGSSIEPTNICTDGSGGKSICSGDAGGALVLDGYQIGISSFGSYRGCLSGDPSGFIRVCQYSSWIEENKKRPE